jgi:peptidoglycan hydrolase-like protein with peptidoglycan-binding domain
VSHLPSTIAEGSTGPDVELAQYELCRDLYLDGPEDVTGSFSAKTKTAVEDYQQSEGLSVDGVVGPDTWAKMLAQHPDPPTLEEGSSGAVVTRLQEFLNLADAAHPPLAADGHFGPLTKQAVADYQASHQVGANGIVGYKTWVIHVGALNAMVASVVGV